MSENDNWEEVSIHGDGSSPSVSPTEEKNVDEYLNNLKTKTSEIRVVKPNFYEELDLNNETKPSKPSNPFWSKVKESVSFKGKK